MLQYQRRFHGYSSLRYLYRLGKSERTRAFSIRFVANPKRVESRAAVVITRKVLKSSPRRNRIRRRVYEWLRINWNNLSQGYDILITVYDPNLAIVSYMAFSDALTELFERAQLLHHEERRS